MSELRTYDVIMTPSSDGSWVLKSEADKVIAELKAKLAEQESEIAELKAQKAQAEDDCAFWKTMAQKTADDNLVMAKQLAEKDAEIRKLNFQMWSARCEAAEAVCDEPRLARCRYMADKFKEVTK